MSTLIRGAKQVVCISNTGEKFKIGADMRDICIRGGNDTTSIVVNREGRIEAILKDTEVEEKYPNEIWANVIEAKDKCIIPGLVDAHTHAVWAGDRVHEFAMKLEGASYLEIHAAGGGIHSTVNATRDATENMLVKLFQKRIQLMSRCGTTLMECKSGYGLDLETELKMLRVIENTRKKAPLSISSTYCGAHAVPKNKTSFEASKEIIQTHLPLIKQLVEGKELNVESVDVFCEKGVFGVQETKEILTTARDLGFMLNFHAEELNHIGGTMMGALLKAEAISHLEEVTDPDIIAMSKSKSVAVLLPTTAHLLKLKPPPARKFIDQMVPVALGSDFNPNAHCMSMPIVMHLACIQLQMTMAEALSAATINAAYAMRRSEETGSIEEGKWCDLVILNAPSWEHLIYQLGGEHDIIEAVLHHGNIVYQKNS